MQILPRINIIKKLKIFLQVEKRIWFMGKGDEENWQIVGRCWASFLHMNLLMRLNPDLQHPVWLMLWPLMTRNCRLLSCMALGWGFVFFFLFFLPPPCTLGCCLCSICDPVKIWIQFSKFFCKRGIILLCVRTSMFAYCPLWRDFHCT